MNRKHLYATLGALALLIALPPSPAGAEDAAITTKQQARIRLSTGREVPGTIFVTSLNATGVRCVIDGSTHATYRPNQVAAVSTIQGIYFYSDKTGGFIFKTHEEFRRERAKETSDRSLSTRGGRAADSRATKSPDPGAIYPDDYWRTYLTGRQLGIDMDTVYTIRAMSRPQVEALRRIAILQGHDWDNMTLNQRLPVARQILIMGTMTPSPTGGARGEGPLRRGRLARADVTPSPTGGARGEGGLLMPLVKVLAAGLAHWVAKDARDSSDNGFLTRLKYAAAKTGRDLLLHSAMRDAFPGAEEEELGALRRVTSLYLDNKLTLGSLAKETAKDEIKAALAKESPKLGFTAEMIDFLVLLHEKPKGE